MGSSAGKREIRVLVTGGTEDRFGPALSVALELRNRSGKIAPAWVGAVENRERKMCKRYHIPYLPTKIPPIRHNLTAAFSYLRETVRLTVLFGRKRPGAIVSFGGPESFPVLTAASFRSVPYFLHEQNTVPCFVNRFFARGAKKVFLGFSVAERSLNGSVEVTGTPIRTEVRNYNDTDYPSNLCREKTTILVANADAYNGAGDFIDTMVPLVKGWSAEGLQVVWETGHEHYNEVKQALDGCRGAILFPQIGDLYPYYALSHVVIGRSTASFLAELAYFGLPCICIPAKKDGGEWVNAGVVENQGWGIRVAPENWNSEIDKAVKEIISNEKSFERMSQFALDNAPSEAAARITGIIVDELKVD